MADVKACFPRGTVASWQDTLTKYSDKKESVTTEGVTESRYYKNANLIGSVYTMGEMASVEIKNGNKTTIFDARPDGKIDRCMEETK